MAYNLSKSNGESLVLLQDGSIDKAYSSLSLIGKNVSNFGDAQNENFVWLLENFANTVQPRNPIQGQIWYNSKDAVLRPLVYTTYADGSLNNWRPLAVLHYGSTATDVNVNALGAPIAACRPGDLWFDSYNKQLHVVTNGVATATETTLIGPEGVTGFGATKMASTRMFDTLNSAHPVIQMIIDSEVIGIVSTVTFTQRVLGAVPGFTKINRGITFKNYNSSTLYSNSSTDVQLYGLHEQLTPALVRRNVTEHIESDWYFDGTVNLGSTGTASVTWDATNSDLLLTSLGGFTLETTSTSLAFDGSSLTPSSSNVTLGTASTRYDRVYANTVDSSVVTATNVYVTSWVKSEVSQAATMYSTDLEATHIRNVSTLAANTVTCTYSLTTNKFTATSIVASVITATNATLSSISATTIDTTSINLNTASAVTVTAETFNGISFIGGTFYGSDFYANGKKLITSDSLASIELNAVRLKGDGASGYIQASVGNVGNTIVQRNGGGDIFVSAIDSTSIVSGSLIATGGLSTSTGTIKGDWSLDDGSRLKATYADLAEYYKADADYEPGTVLEFGGEFDVTIAQDSTRRVAGVVSTNPAYLMNDGLKGENVVAIALAGRVPCKVRGIVRKGDLMIAAGSGFARAEYSPILGSIIGKALENFDGVEGVIEVAIGRM